MYQPSKQSATVHFIFVGSVLFSFLITIITLKSGKKFIFVMVKRGVLFEVRTEFLNNI
jgi:hypothetical protein